MKKVNFRAISILMLTVLAGGNLAHSQNRKNLKSPKKNSVSNSSPQRNSLAKMPLNTRKQVAADWDAAKKLYLAKNFKQAAVAFFHLTKNGGDEVTRKRAKYFLGASLYNMNLKQVAAFPFVDLVRSGDSQEKRKSFDYLIMIADDLAEPSFLNYALNHIKENELSDVARSIFLGRLGEANLNQGRVNEARKYFERALDAKRNENSIIYNLGLTELIAKNPDRGAQWFAQLSDKMAGRSVTDLQKGLAMMGQARALYQAKKWADSAELYRQIPKDHPLYRQSLMELSWALFRGGQFRSALSPLRTLHTPFYENFYDPESLLLHGTILLFVCHYDEILALGKSFDDNYYPAFARIQEWLETSHSDEDYYLEIIKAKKALLEIRLTGESKTENILPFFVLRTLMEDADIKNLIEYLEKNVNERKILDKVYSKTLLYPYAKQILDGRKVTVQKNLGRAVKNRLEAKLVEFNEFVTQFEFLKYEMMNGQRTTLKDKLTGDAVSEVQIDKEMDRDYFVDNGYRFWPFEGEYWRDELGNYLNVGVNRCEK